MAAPLSRWLVGLGLIAAGAVFGPVLAAAITAAAASPQERASSAFNLLVEFDGRDRTIPMASIDVMGDVRDCGHDPDALFTKKDLERFPSRKPWKWTPHAGFFALWLARSSAWRIRLLDIRAAQLNESTSPFGALFLRECMRQTPFASSCQEYTRKLLGKLAPAHSGPPDAGNALDTSGETGTICTYLDGVAARNGRPLSDRKEAHAQ
ncbi:MAG TPA: hypothetical protein VM662_03955 [Sphingomonas sp.]|nr:hypothetical protein [Sphingomonas sp.]